MEVTYHKRDRLSPQEEQAHGVRHVALDELLEHSDAVMVQVPYGPDTHHLIGATELARMKKTAVLVNTARGGVVDDAALAAALRTGQIAAAGLDVAEGEPSFHPDLLTLPNVALDAAYRRRYGARQSSAWCAKRSTTWLACSQGAPLAHCISPVA